MRPLRRSVALALLFLLPLAQTACICFGAREERAARPVPTERPAAPPAVAERGDGLAYPTGNAATSALWVEKHAPSEVVVGEPFAYEIRIENLTPDPILGITVEDRLPRGFRLEEQDAAVGEEGVVLLRIDRLEGRETRTLRLRGTALEAGTLTNCVSVSVDNEWCLSHEAVRPSLSISKTGPEEVSACDTIRYEIVVTNDGEGTVRGVVVEDDLPEGLQALAEGTRFEVGDLATGDSRRFVVEARPTRTGTFTNRAIARGAGGVAADSEEVVTRVVRPALELDVECPGVRFGGQTIDARIVVSNTGDGRVPALALEVPVPAGSSFVSAEDGGALRGGTVVWALPALEPGAAHETGLVLRAERLGPLTIEARAEGACAEPVSASCTTEVRGIPAVLLEVVDMQDPVAVGDLETYVIRVTNQGTLADTGLRVVCELEDEMRFVEASGPTPGRAEDGVVTFEPLPSLAPKEQAAWRVVVRAVAPGDVRFHVRLETDELGRPVEETEATHFYE